MSERRYTEQEEALEIKSLRRILAAYAKYANPIPRSPSLLYPAVPCTNRPPFIPGGAAIPAVDWKYVSSGTRC